VNLRNWRYKCQLQRAFSALPGGHHLNYLFQRSLGGLPLPNDQLPIEYDKALRHRQALDRLGIGDGHTFEFGAGYDLHLPLIQAALGVGQQTVVDLRRVARGPLVVDMARRLHDLDGVPADWAMEAPQPDASMADVLATNRITYMAPADARASGLAAGSVDAVITTSTLEHIPRADLVLILAECHRVVRDDGGLSMLIDYSDHWSHFDHSITAYNFLQYSEVEWRRLNPDLNYQNRMRNSEFLALFDAAGFDIIDIVTTGGDAESLRALSTVTLAPEFADFDPVDLAITTAHITARRRSKG
jgi:SAM-dependent methyltransferase